MTSYRDIRLPTSNDPQLTVRIAGHAGAEVPVLLLPTALADFANTPSQTILQFKVQGA